MDDHSGTYSPFAIPCMEGKHTPSRDIWTPHSEDNVSLFEGSGGLLSGANATSCEAKAPESADRTFLKVHCREQLLPYSPFDCREMSLKTLLTSVADSLTQIPHVEGSSRLQKNGVASC